MKGSYERQRKARDEETNPASKGKKPTADQVSNFVNQLCERNSVRLRNSDRTRNPDRLFSFHKTFSPLDGVDSADLASLVLWPSPFAAPRNHVGIHDARAPPRARRLTPQQCTTRRNRAVDGSHRRASWSEGYQTPNAHRNTSGVQILLQTAPIPFARPSGGG